MILYDTAYDFYHLADDTMFSDHGFLDTCPLFYLRRMANHRV